jgi:hypothetical protein
MIWMGNDKEALGPHNYIEIISNSHVNTALARLKGGKGES